jgi:hypothetical protein
MHLWIKSLDDEVRIEVNHGDGEETWVGNAAWNADGSKIVYLVTTPKTCEYYIRDVHGLRLSAPRLVYQCPPGSYGKIEFIHSDTRFVYTEARRAGAPYELFELDMLSGEKRKLPQPELVLGGNSQFDVHPSENKLLISSPDKQLWEGFYSLNLDTDQLDLLFAQDAYICCGIWDHSGQRVVLMGEYPAFELVSYDLQGKDPQVIYSGMHQLRSPHRHINGTDYLFVSGHVNQNVHYYALEDNQSRRLINTSVDDRLTALSNSTRQLAYISLSSGNEEIWLSDSQGNNQQKLTRFNDSRHYFDLQWFPDDSKLVGLTLNEVHVIDANTGAYKRLFLPQGEYKAVSVKDTSTIALSAKVNHQWRLHLYDLKQDKLEMYNDKWQFARFSPDAEDNLWVDTNYKVYSGPENDLSPVDTPLTARTLLSSKVISLQKWGNRLVWQVFDSGQYQLYQRTGNEAAKPLFTTDSRHFDLAPEGILYHKVESANADIYATSASL